MERCKICRKDLPLDERVTLSIAGRPCGGAHRGCATLVSSSVAVAGKVALGAGIVALRTRYPKVYKAFEGFRAAISESRRLQPPPSQPPTTIEMP